MTRSQGTPAQEIDSEPERTLRQRLKENQNQSNPKEQEEMEHIEGANDDQAFRPRRTMEDFVTQSPNTNRTNDAARLRLFKFTLGGRAKTWLNTLPAGSIATWEDLQKTFLGKYFPPAKTIKLRNEIFQFSQESEEHLSEA
ncbi:hypothetical protein H6P81_002850 [Aristolochia fimbriata]|uniref:Retrotransposon gag domain-containing protein n=1 Tax=Aristolochia fimbriata TaxID=158543 RepID=A0AAV7FF14_ARIFI|nr:hypothetical protein H6P81_002850 [Aristolochia fimbriata]